MIDEVRQDLPYGMRSLVRSLRFVAVNVARTVMILLLVLTTAAAANPSNAAPAPTNRTVYVTVTDGKGAPVTDLTIADFVVKEGGKEREVVKAEPATARMRLAVGVEERLTPDTAIRQGIFEFLKRVSSAAEISLITIGLANRTVVDYTTDPNMLVGAINKFTLNASRDSNVPEGILEIADTFIKNRPERPAMVIVAIAGGQSSTESRVVLERLGASGATMYAATLGSRGVSGSGVGTLGDESGRDQVLGDGPRQSGGRHIDVNATAGIPKALQQIADDLLAQYAITYVLPDGVKPAKRFNISTKRRGVSLRAPSTIPDR
jgi:hypothetical protein